jgi:hypothetical protein
MAAGKDLQRKPGRKIPCPAGKRYTAEVAVVTVRHLKWKCRTPRRWVRHFFIFLIGRDFTSNPPGAGPKWGRVYLGPSPQSVLFLLVWQNSSWAWPSASTFLLSLLFCNTTRLDRFSWSAPDALPEAETHIENVGLTSAASLSRNYSVMSSSPGQTFDRWLRWRCLPVALPH